MAKHHADHGLLCRHLRGAHLALAPSAPDTARDTENNQMADG